MTKYSFTNFLKICFTFGNILTKLDKLSWIECHRNDCLTMKDTDPNTILLGDSIIAGLARYQIAWKNILCC